MDLLFCSQNPTGDAGFDNYWSYVLGTGFASELLRKRTKFPVGTKFNWFFDAGGGAIFEYIVERKSFNGYVQFHTQSNRLPFDASW